MSDRRLLELALKGLEFERVKVDEEILEIKTQLGGSRAAGSARRKRRLTAASRKALSVAAKRRWAAHRAATRKPARRKPKISAAQKKAASERMKAYWAKKKAQKKPAKESPQKPVA